MAVSAAKTSPSAPSFRVLKISLTSALVGSGASIIDSSKFVATKTSFLAFFASFITSFCIEGINSIATSRDISPRSNKIASDSLIMSSRFDRPFFDSIFEIRKLSLPINLRNALTSSPELANERAK